jgi:hypothetical protein
MVMVVEILVLKLQAAPVGLDVLGLDVAIAGSQAGESP